MRQWFNDRHNRIAGSLALLLLGVSGAGHRLLAPRVSVLDDIPEIPQHCLDALPYRVGEWSGADQPVDARTEGILDADDYIRRVYRKRGLQAVGLFVAVRRRDVAFAVPAADLVPHHPEVCYPAHGWKLEDTNVVDLMTQQKRPLPVQVFRFIRSHLETERTTVLTYYVVDGERGYSPTERRPSGWRPKGDFRYVAQVELSGVDGGIARSGESLAMDFALASEAEILSLIDSCLNSAGS